jgi:hypothetical protein
MPQTPTARTSVVASRIKALLEQFKDDDTFFDPPIKGVSYGDQEKIPQVPWVCIEPADKNRTWPPTASDVTEVDHEVIIYVYHTSNTGVESLRLTVDQLSEAIEEYLNINHRHLQDADGNDLIIYGYCVRIEHGYTVRANTMYRSARITWRGKCRNVDLDC